MSILLPVFDGARTVARAVGSIQAQTFPDWELLICDDGSRDDSGRICDTFASADPRIRVFRHDRNLGLATTMNHLVSVATGEYCAVQEQDDISVPERLEWEVAELDRRPEVGVASGVAAWVDDEGRIWGHFPWFLKNGGQFPEERSALVRHLYVEQSKIVNAAAMIRLSLFRRMGLAYDPEAQLSIDWQFFVDAAHRAAVFGIDRVLVLVARGAHRRSLTTRKELQFREARRCIRILYRRYKNDPESPIDHALYRKAMATQLVLEARYLGPRRGGGRLLKALSYAPTHKRAWKTAREFALRGSRWLRAGGRLHRGRVVGSRGEP